METPKFKTADKLWKYEIERQAARKGIKHRQIIYHVIDFEEMSEIAARSGFATRVHHWRFGQESIEQKQHYRYGLSIIYELVTNTDPIHAYLLECNSPTSMKSVMAHVIGHANVFDMNPYGQKQNKRMLGVMGNAAQWYDEMCQRHGTETVQDFYDKALSLEYLIDIHAPLRMPVSPQEKAKNEEEKETGIEQSIQRIKPPNASPYLDDFLNPEDWLKSERARLKEEDTKAREKEKGTRIPEKPERDVLKFLIDQAPLEEWQRGILAMIRQDSYYFAMQGRTRILHEGWASYVEEEIMYKFGMLADSETVEFNNHLAGVQRRTGFNPYVLGYDFFCDIKFRWDTGRHGRIWDDCADYNIKNNWDAFMAYKQIYELYGTDSTEFEKRWLEFSLFAKEFREGKLGFTKHLTQGPFYYTQNLLPYWVRYQQAEQELADLQKRLEETREIEQPLGEIEVLLKNDPSDESDPISVREHLFKIRRDLFLRKNREDLWAWTSDELLREIFVVKKMVELKERFNATGSNVTPLPIDLSWDEYLKRYPDPIRLVDGDRKMAEVITTCDDATFIDEFFTKEFCERNKYFLAEKQLAWDDETDDISQHYFINSRSFERIKKRLLFRYTNLGLPVIVVQDGNWRGRGELYLKHIHTGVDMDIKTPGGKYLSPYLSETLKQIFHLWGGERPVHLETVITIIETTKEWWWQGPQKPRPEDETPKKKKGNRVIISYGPAKKAGKREFSYAQVDVVEFPDPF